MPTPAAQPAAISPTLADSLIAPLATIIDRVIPDPAQRDSAKLALLDAQTRQYLNVARLYVATAGSWTDGAAARP